MLWVYVYLLQITSHQLLSLCRTKANVSKNPFPYKVPDLSTRGALSVSFSTKHTDKSSPLRSHLQAPPPHVLTLRAGEFKMRRAKIELWTQSPSEFPWAQLGALTPDLMCFSLELQLSALYTHTYICESMSYESMNQ